MSKEPNELNEIGGMVEAELELDARGLYCPEPVMLLHNKIRDIEAGQILKLVGQILLLRGMFQNFAYIWVMNYLLRNSKGNSITTL